MPVYFLNFYSTNRKEIISKYQKNNEKNLKPHSYTSSSFDSYLSMLSQRTLSIIDKLGMNTFINTVYLHRKFTIEQIPQMFFFSQVLKID